MARSHSFIYVTLVLLGLAAHASAQIPTATGTTIQLPQGSAYQLFIPTEFVPSSTIDLLVHFHGADSVFRNNAKYANRNAIEVTVNLGAGSTAYSTPFAADTTLFGDILNDALTTARNRPNISDTATWRNIGVSSFSAGYGAVREILKQPSYYSQIDCLLMADTIYASYTSGSDHSPLDSQMVDFRRFALDSKNGIKSMIVTHSNVLTYTYSNTAETSDDLLAHLSLNAAAYNVTGLGGISFYRHAKSGNFEMFGATGADGTAHLQHLNYSGQWLDDLPIATTVPEPTSLSLLTAAPALLLRRRRKCR